MKLYYLFLLVMFLLMSCESTPKRCVVGTISGRKVVEYTIDGHDYIKRDYGIAHSGNCKKCKQERDSIINVIIQKLGSEYDRYK